jgi:peptidoglycan-N-acetylglucosamine deacetylase
VTSVNRLCAVSVDLDACRYYRAIHGLSEQQAGSDPVLCVAVERLASWAASLAIPLTWFVVGRDLEQGDFADALVGLFRRGHELANHSLDHLYDLTRRDSATIRQQVAGGSEVLSRLTGKTSHGFRAPGYTMTDPLHGVLRELSVPYDSSVFPCPIYYGAKAVALAGQRLFGRESPAILDSRQVLLAPVRPYRMGTPYHRAGDGLLELPIQVTPGLRIPFIGTTLTMLGTIGAGLLTNSVIGEPLVNLELHGIDALDFRDGLEDLGRVQPDLRRAWRRKLDVLSAVIQRLRRARYTFVTLEQAADANREIAPSNRVEPRVLC